MASESSAVCVLVSGGLDSAYLMDRLDKNRARLIPLYIRCGLRWEAAEIYWLRKYLPAVGYRRIAPLSIIDLPLNSLYGTHWSLTGQGVPSAKSADSAAYIPGRNVFLLSAAAVFCTQRSISRIAIGALQGNPFGDASPRFLKSMANSLSQALNRSIRILAPLRLLNKTQIIRNAISLPLTFTFSCLDPKGRVPCGQCNKCAERKRGFKRAGFIDPTKYHHG